MFIAMTLTLFQRYFGSTSAARPKAVCLKQKAPGRLWRRELELAATRPGVY